MAFSPRRSAARPFSCRAPSTRPQRSSPRTVKCSRVKKKGGKKKPHQETMRAFTAAGTSLSLASLAPTRRGCTPASLSLAPTRRGCLRAARASGLRMRCVRVGDQPAAVSVCTAAAAALRSCPARCPLACRCAHVSRALRCGVACSDWCLRVPSCAGVLPNGHFFRHSPANMNGGPWNVVSLRADPLALPATRVHLQAISCV